MIVSVPATIAAQPQAHRVHEAPIVPRNGQTTHARDAYAASESHANLAAKFLQGGITVGTGLVSAGIVEAVLQPIMLAWSHRIIRNCARVACAAADPATVAACLLTWQGVEPSAFNHPIGPPGHTNDGLCDNGSDPVQYGCVLGGIAGGIAFFGLGALLGYTVIVPRIMNTLETHKPGSEPESPLV